METEWIVEGKAALAVPAGARDDPFHKLAFFNPLMAFNRTVGARAVSAAFPGGVPLAVDGLCATGARGIRYALEARVEKMVFVDANAHAIKLLKKNVKKNKLEKKGVIVEGFLNPALYSLEPSPQLIELDPFGSPSPFLGAAIERIENGGMVSSTATDFAKLAGANARACRRHYDAVPLRTSAGHEIGVRILLGKIARTAAVLDRFIEPQLSFFEGHAGKAMVTVRNGASKADWMLSHHMGLAWWCRWCLARGVGGESPQECRECGKPVAVGGPLWTAPLSDTAFVEKVREVNAGHPVDFQRKQVEKMLALIAGENGLPPLFYNIHEAAGLWKTGIPPTESIEGILAQLGYQYARTHFEPTGIRTDAPAKALRECMKGR